MLEVLVIAVLLALALNITMLVVHSKVTLTSVVLFILSTAMWAGLFSVLVIVIVLTSIVLTTA